MVPVRACTPLKGGNSYDCGYYVFGTKVGTELEEWDWLPASVLTFDIGVN